MLSDTITDAIKTSAILLAILLPLVTAIFQYRREERKHALEREKAGTVGQAGMVAIGGALASKGEVLEYVNALAKQTEAVDRQTEYMARLAEANLELAGAHRDRAETLRTFRDEAEAIRRALQEIVHLMRRREGGAG